MFLLFISDNKLELQGIYSMTPEQLRRKNTNGKAHSVFTNLVDAVNKGAIGAQYADGEVVIYPAVLPDKDSFEQMVVGYNNLLRSCGTPPKDALRNTENIRSRFYAGTATQQIEVFNGLRSVIDSSLNHKNNN